MRKLLWLGSLFAVGAFACADLTGVYQMADIHFIKVKSLSDCKGASLTYGDLEKDVEGPARVRYGDKQTYKVGERNCWLGDCYEVKASEGGLSIQGQIIWPYLSEDRGDQKGHGLCDWTERVYSKQGDDLKVTFKVFACSDGFAGDVSEVYPLAKAAE